MILKSIIRPIPTTLRNKFNKLCAMSPIKLNRLSVLK